MLRKIHLYGALKKFSKNGFELDVSDTIDLFSALKSRFGNEFKIYLRDNPELAVVLSKANKKDLLPVYSEFINAPYDKKSTHIHIIPSTDGSGVEIAIALGMAAGATTTIIVGAIINAAISMAISAIAQMLAPKPDTGAGSERPAERPSFLFNGAENVMEQGYQVPVVYGTHMTGSVVVSAGISVEQLPFVSSRVDQPAAVQPLAPAAELFQWDGGR